MNAEIVWRPQPRQAEFMRRPEPEALYGGAAGGGKSDALVIEALRQVHIPHYRGLILRKTYPQLSDLVDKSMAYYKRAFPTAQYNATSHVWVFPSGAKIYFGSMQYTKDRTNYQGKAFDFIGFDELTHFEWEEYSYMMSRNRPTGPGTRVYLRATTNPGGVGHGWVKARFITPAPPGTPIVEQFPVRMPDGTEKVLERARVFIPSSVFDNPALLENDPDYLASLASLPEAEKQALLYGSWDSFSGQVFTEWRNDPGHYQDQRWTHVIAPFAIPRHWKIYRGYDFGFSKPFSVGWYAADEEGRLYRIKELYGCTGRPNEGLRIDPVEQARRIREAEQNDPMLKGRTILGVADPAIFDESRGESIAAMMERGPHFLHWVPGDHTRLAGKMQFHYRLAFDGEGRPMFQVFSTCRHFIRTLPNLVYDESNVEDIDTRQEDHIYDECRYVLMENPISPPRQTVRLPTDGFAGELAEKLNRTGAQLQAKNEMLSRRDNARTQWIAGVSHDVRTPLALILGWAEQLEQDALLPDSSRQKAAGIRTQCEKLRTLIDDLNLTSKLEYGAQPLRRKDLRAGPLFRQLVAQFCESPLAERCGITLEQEDPAEQAVLSVDEALLARLLDNLLNNSVRHNPKPVNITVHTRRAGKRFCLTVADDGIGYPSAVLAALNAAEPAENAPHILGLYVVQQIAAAHGGRAVFGQNSPHGAKAVVYLPLG